MTNHGLRAFWNEPRPAHPPIRVWRDWALVGVAVAGTAIEAMLRQQRAWLPVAILVSIVIACSLLWRRTRPLPMVAVAFGTLIAFDLLRIVAINVTGLTSIAAALVLPYALWRWGSGREAISGLGLILIWLGVTHVADPTTIDEVVAGYGFFLLSAALGAAFRFHATSRLREIEQAKLQQRNAFARDLHDTVGHHISGIAIQAQAGQAIAANDPDRALAVLATIEAAAARALAEMRAIVGVVRDGAQPDLLPQPGINDIAQLARATSGPTVDVQLAGRLDGLSSSINVALYRITQEALTNVRRHARNATRVFVEVHGGDDRVRLTIHDDGEPVEAHVPPSGFGLVGIHERASLLGGTFHAGPAVSRGWIVEVTLPLREATGPSGVTSELI